jgi:hypothetical protein
METVRAVAANANYVNGFDVGSGYLALHTRDFRFDPRSSCVVANQMLLRIANGDRRRTCFAPDNIAGRLRSCLTIAHPTAKVRAPSTAQVAKRQGPMRTTKWLSLFASFVSVACSGGATSPTTTQPKPSELNASSLSVAPAGAPSQPGSPSAVAVLMAPSTACTIHPEGVTDPKRTRTLHAGADGEVRFSRPPQDQAWGTRLALDCSPNGSAQETRLVDLDDSSTFKAESQADLEPHIVGTRPALTGDLSAFALQDLLQHGYPPRPDVAQKPKEYAQWVHDVTSPLNIYNTVPVSSLGAPATLGQYEGNFFENPRTPGQYAPWTGFIQAAGGFHTEPNNGAIPFAQSSVLYGQYIAAMFAPAAWGCSSGNCSEDYMWAGIGGWDTQAFGGGFVPDLLQSGFRTFGSSAPTVQLFAEWVGGTDADPPITWLPPAFTAGDVVLFSGWAGDANCTILTQAFIEPNLGCFWYIDGNKWIQTQTVNPPVDSTWWPATVEYINERNTPGQSQDYFFNEMTGQGIDLGGTSHMDPGNSSGNGDPYVIVTQDDLNGNPCSTAEWANGAVTPPEDPMFFVWQDCGSN